MIQKMRLLSLIVLIAFTFLPLFQVVHIGYADDHPPTREEFEEIQEENKDLKERVEELEKQLNPDRGFWDVAGDVANVVFGTAAAAVGAGVAFTGTASGAATFGLSAPVSLPVAAAGAGGAIWSLQRAGAGTSNLYSDISNLFD